MDPTTEQPLLIQHWMLPLLISRRRVNNILIFIASSRPKFEDIACQLEMIPFRVESTVK